MNDKEKAIQIDRILDEKGTDSVDQALDILKTIKDGNEVCSRINSRSELRANPKAWGILAFFSDDIKRRAVRFALCEMQLGANNIHDLSNNPQEKVFFHGLLQGLAIATVTFFSFAQKRDVLTSLRDCGFDLNQLFEADDARPDAIIIRAIQDLRTRNDYMKKFGLTEEDLERGANFFRKNTGREMERRISSGKLITVAEDVYDSTRVVPRDENER